MLYTHFLHKNRKFEHFRAGHDRDINEFHTPSDLPDSLSEKNTLNIFLLLICYFYYLFTIIKLFIMIL